MYTNPGGGNIRRGGAKPFVVWPSAQHTPADMVQKVAVQNGASLGCCPRKARAEIFVSTIDGLYDGLCDPCEAPGGPLKVGGRDTFRPNTTKTQRQSHNFRRLGLGLVPRMGTAAPQCNSGMWLAEIIFPIRIFLNGCGICNVLALVLVIVLVCRFVLSGCVVMVLVYMAICSFGFRGGCRCTLLRSSEVAAKERATVSQGGAKQTPAVTNLHSLPKKGFQLLSHSKHVTYVRLRHAKQSAQIEVYVTWYAKKWRFSNALSHSAPERICEKPWAQTRAPGNWFMVYGMHCPPVLGLSPV
jgi:hypothetical protein|mmetsp:Transcript_10003/g.18892  ORF Transcript_10003/g.18892 Transcript_10003/m.18892 type:complete len:299 (+) Transcript_10003:992-1888(+)